MKSTVPPWGMREMSGPKKDKITITVNRGNYKYLKRPHVNASGLVDVLVKKYRDGEIDL
jgi:hypothetical protein